MDDKTFKIILAIAEEGNMTRAAKAIGVSQPTLTYRVKQAEEECGFELFKKSHAGVELTPAGEYFCGQIKGLLSEYDSIISKGKSISSAVHKRAIRFATSMSDYSLVSMVTHDYLRKYPDSRFEFVSGNDINLYKLVEQGKADISFSTDIFMQANHEANFCFKKVYETREGAILSVKHPLAARRTISLSDLAGQVLLIGKKGIVSYNVDKIRSQIEAEPHGIQLRDLENIDDMIISLQTKGSLALYDSSALGFIPDDIVFIPLEPIMKNNIGVIYSKANEDLLSQLLEYIEVYITDIPTA